MIRALLVPILAVTAVLSAAAGPVWRAAAPGHEWAWPRDLYAHREYRTEWWYFTGHLQAADRPQESPLLFQLTFFRVGMIPAGADLPAADWAARGGVMAHAVLADPQSGRRIFSEVLRRETPELAGCGDPGDSLVAWVQAPGGTDGRWRLTYDGESFGLHVRDDRQGLAFDLDCRPEKPVVLHGQGGFSAKHQGGSFGSLYATFPRLAVTGTAGFDGRPAPVTGQAWLDREIFSSTLAPDQKGWDWLSLQLDDGREVMLYRLFGEGPGGEYASGTLVAPGGDSRPLTAGDWRLTPTDHWDSPTGARYPVSWRLEIPSADLDLELRGLAPDQENRSPRTGIHYWEGGIVARPRGEGASRKATTSGRGFVEMTGYGPNCRPPV